MGSEITVEGVVCVVLKAGTGWAKVQPEGKRCARMAVQEAGAWRWREEVQSPTETKRTRG